MGTEVWLTWIPAILALVAVGVAGWLLWSARKASEETAQRAEAVRRMAGAVEASAEKTGRAATTATEQAERAWEQVKLTRSQLDDARQERQASTQAEQWEWAYALTTAARELVNSCHELIRVSLDTQVAPHYRQSADRHYRQAGQRWQDTMIKAIARTQPPLEMQQQVATFAEVHQRLHGHIGVLLRAVETNTLGEGDTLTKQIHGMRHELNNAHRNLQRIVSSNLSTPQQAPNGQNAGHQVPQANGTAQTQLTQAPNAPQPDAEQTQLTPAVPPSAAQTGRTHQSGKLTPAEPATQQLANRPART
ncbi:hypothetical protein QFW96_22575 [Saccharopolyspora sp. TS4A08]|uniref:Uncharacterized protein n=1 Tax=Saccharopolyspora ipomoeae TaxID=3042027 RepID=A0ABT6PTW3_9PSEU|nr:hypothetical protein [Saccharopolyspora sp. TS4A08]MDI2031431.1 hypothetical protein [Saccharopolyspora sp. TS4A08]